MPSSDDTGAMDPGACCAARPPISDAQLIDRLHGGLPLVDRPFAALAPTLGISEDELIERLRGLLASGVLSRFGPLYRIERAGGEYVLCAMRVPCERLDAVATIVNAMPEVAHNYERDHAFNLWFVLAAETPVLIDRAKADIESQAGLPVFAFPKSREYFLDLHLTV